MIKEKELTSLSSKKLVQMNFSREDVFCILTDYPKRDLLLKLFNLKILGCNNIIFNEIQILNRNKRRHDIELRSNYLVIHFSISKSYHFDGPKKFLNKFKNECYLIRVQYNLGDHNLYDRNIFANEYWLYLLDFLISNIGNITILCDKNLDKVLIASDYFTEIITSDKNIILTYYFISGITNIFSSLPLQLKSDDRFIEKVLYTENYGIFNSFDLEFSQDAYEKDCIMFERELVADELAIAEHVFMGRGYKVE